MTDDRFTIREIGDPIKKEDFLSTYPEAEKIAEEIHTRGVEFGEYLDSLKIGNNHIVLQVVIDVANLKINTIFNNEVLK